jgi:hypothetical protein
MGEADWPFMGTEALADGRVSRRSLRRRNERVYRNVYLPTGCELTDVTRGVAAWLWSGRKATAAGSSAAALHGSQWLDPRLPAELYRCNGKPVDGIVIHRDELWDDERCIVRGMPVTTPARTAFDLGRRNRRTTGLDLMDGGAESPQETRTRLVLIDAGLPRPQTQIVVCDDFGDPFARIDMGYEEWKVGVEYDGIQHWTDPARRAYDIDKHAELLARGWRVMRVSADMLRRRPEVIVARVCAALHQAGAEWPVIARYSPDHVS